MDVLELHSESVGEIRNSKWGTSF